MPLEIKLEIVLDNNESTGKQIHKYFPGDQINGKIYFTSNQNYTLKNFRLEWQATIQVQPIQANRETKTYFEECWKLDTVNNSPIKKTNVYQTTLILASTSSKKEPTIDLKKNKQLGLAFKLYVPNDRPLPSCTEIPPNKIIYSIKASLEDKFFAQKNVPVYELIYTKTPDMTLPQRLEQSFQVLSSNQFYNLTMRVTLPFRATQPGMDLPLSINIENDVEYSRRQGISISLMRITEVIANGRAYASHGEKMHRIVNDLSITRDEKNQNVQLLRTKLPIPKNIMPNISFESSQLLHISYYIRVQVFAQEGIYTSLDGKKSQFMMLDLPLIIGTKSNIDSNNSSAISSPQLSYATLPTNALFRKGSNGSESVRSTLSDEVKRQDNFDTISSRLSLSTGNLFRKGSNGSDSVVTTRSDEVKKQDNFDTISGRLSLSSNNIFRKISSGSGSVKSNLSNDENRSHYSQPTNSEMSRKISSGSGSVKTAPSSFNDVATRISNTTHHQVSPNNKKSPPQTTGGVFNLFPDDDDDDEEEEEEEKEEVFDSGEKTQAVDDIKTNATPKPTTNQGGDVFNMFSDDDDDDDDDEEKEDNYQDATSVQIDELLVSMNSPPYSPTAKNQFEAFKEKTEDSREKVPQNSILEKPNQRDVSLIYKPNAYDSSDDSSDDMDDESDILGILARRERQKNHR